MLNLFVIFLVAAMVTMAGRYIYKAKRRGVRCIGCPDSGQCSGNCAHCCCHSKECSSPQS